MNCSVNLKYQISVDPSIDSVRTRQTDGQTDRHLVTALTR